MAAAPTGRGGVRRLPVLLALLACALPARVVAARATPAPLAGKVFLSVEEALALAFPECEVARETWFLSELEGQRVAKLSGATLASRVVRPYVARREGRLVGTAYFDAHRVRTVNEVLMFVVAPDERLARLEVLSFAEPLEYLPRAAFYAQFVGHCLDEELDLGHGIRGVSGASLSARAATDAARRTLALHRVLAERHAPERDVPPGR